MEKKMKSRLDPSILEYVLRIKRVAIVSCETIAQVLEFEDEMNAWMDLMEEKREEVK